MRALYILCFALFGLTNAETEFCYNKVHTVCGSTKNSVGNETHICNGNYSAAHKVMPDLQKYVMQHLSHSFQYLLMSTNFETYEKNRQGFAKLYRKLSDSTWDDAIELIKYITKRGGAMNFDVQAPEDPNKEFYNTFNMHELESLSRALDMHKSLAERAHKIHGEVTKRESDYHDAETISYLEKEYVHKHANIIRDLAGYTNDLTNMLMNDDSSLSVYLFDEYLQKVI